MEGTLRTQFTISHCYFDGKIKKMNSKLQKSFKLINKKIFVHGKCTMVVMQPKRIERNQFVYKCNNIRNKNLFTCIQNLYSFFIIVPVSSFTFWYRARSFNMNLFPFFRAVKYITTYNHINGTNARTYHLTSHKKSCWNTLWF